MDINFTYLSIIQVCVLTLMGIMVLFNPKLTSKQKLTFLLTFSSIAVISIVEQIFYISQDKGKSWKWVNFICSFLGFSLAPFVPILFAYSVNPSKTIKWILLVVGIFQIFLFISLPFDLVYKVTDENTYERGPLFFLYTTSFLVGIVYLIVVTIQMNHKYQNNNTLVLYLNLLLVFVATIVQVFFQEIHVTWFFITALSVLYYEYCNNLWHRIDGLTKLLSQESFFANTKKLKNNGILVIFDIDKFKLVNDTYGHLVGDEYLRVFGEKLLNTYSNDGYCYRIGGDEFLVILNEEADVEKLNEEFKADITKYNKNYATNPNVSFGYIKFKKGDDILIIRDLADEKMYAQKRVHQDIKNK